MSNSVDNSNFVTFPRLPPSAREVSHSFHDVSTKVLKPRPGAAARHWRAWRFETGNVLLQASGLMSNCVRLVPFHPFSTESSQKSQFHVGWRYSLLTSPFFGMGSYYTSYGATPLSRFSLSSRLWKKANLGTASCFTSASQILNSNDVSRCFWGP